MRRESTLKESKQGINIKAIRAILIVVVAVFAIAACFCGFKYYEAQQQYNKSMDAYRELSDNYVRPHDRAGINTTAGSSKSEEDCSPITVDFEELGNQVFRGEISGWLYCPDTIINYPVVHCDDNAFYLEHQLNGDANSCGTLFVDCKNKGDFSDPNTIIYGHHMADGQMFNSLKLYRQEEGYYSAHPFMYLNTPERDYKLHIYSTFVSDTQSKAFQTEFNDDSQFQDFIDFTVSNSQIDTGVNVTTDDRVVTLVTCSYEFNNARTIVCGILEPIGDTAE